MANKFEYLVTVPVLARAEDADTEQQKKLLNLAGQDGWELVAVVPVEITEAPVGMDVQMVRFYYKREI